MRITFSIFLVFFHYKETFGEDTGCLEPGTDAGNCIATENGNYCEVTNLRNHGCEDDGVGRYQAADGDVEKCIRYQEEKGLPFPVIVDGECYGSPTCDDPFEHDGVESVVYKLQECKEEVPKDVCGKYNGIPHHRSKPVCCKKECPKCGGRRCGKAKDAYSKKQKSECCAWKIKRQGKTCGSNGRKAPCNLPSNQ